jgi:hypothetical protein
MLYGQQNKTVLAFLALEVHSISVCTSSSKQLILYSLINNSDISDKVPSIKTKIPTNVKDTNIFFGPSHLGLSALHLETTALALQKTFPHSTYCFHSRV